MNAYEACLEHAKLAKEYILLPVNADSEEAYKPISKRKIWIEKRIKELKKIERR